MIDPNKISRLLKTRLLGRVMTILDEIDSTNAEAMRRLDGGKAPDGLVIIAEKQTAGKGRRGNDWFSDGGLCMTAVLDAGGRLSGPVALAAGIGVAEGLSTATGLDFFLKYPNDVISSRTGGKKIGGILAQSKRGSLVVGIGVNVGRASFPAGLAESATSLALLGIDLDLETAAAGILNSLEPWLFELKGGNFSLIRERWLKLNCTVGGRVVVRDATPAVEGVAVGLDADGALLVETDRGLARVLTGGLSDG
ncbi:MAG: biotin--[acetyl-CoA-carboxylase] ligase [Nitrospinae bacterium]|nr:biotin--[acetyl-CoA-carboxylase] ligase [Nitrospinota bacterium]